MFNIISCQGIANEINNEISTKMVKIKKRGNNKCEKEYGEIIKHILMIGV